MHIMEGFLPWQWCLVWWIIALPCLMLGIYQLKKLLKVDREALPLLGVTGGFIFILSSLKLPSVTGSCSHPTGTGLSTMSLRAMDHSRNLRNCSPVPESVSCSWRTISPWR